MTIELFIPLTFAILFELLSIRKILSSGLFKNGPSGDGASYFFHYIDWKNRKIPDSKRYLLGSTLSSSYPKIYYYYLNMFSLALLKKYSWFPNYLLKIFIILSLTLFSYIYLNLGVLQSILVISCLTIFCSELAVIYSYNLTFFNISPRYLYSVLSSFAVLIMLLDIKLYGYSPLVIIAPLLMMTSHFNRQVVALIFLPFLLLTDLQTGLLCIATIVISLCFYKDLRYICIAHLNSFKTQIMLRKEYWKRRKQNATSASNYQRLYKFLRSMFGVHSFAGMNLYLNLLAFVGVVFITEMQELKIFALQLIITLALLNLRFFEFVGEPWRYIPYTIPVPLLFFGTQEVIQSNFNPTLLLFFIPTMGYSFMHLLFRNSYVSFRDINAEIIELVRSHKMELKNAVWFSLPWRIGTYACNLGFGLKTTEFPILKVAQIPDFVNIYPLIGINTFDNLQRSCTHLIIENSYKMQIEELGYILNEATLISKTNKMSVYRIIN